MSSIVSEIFWPTRHPQPSGGRPLPLCGQQWCPLTKIHSLYYGENPLPILLAWQLTSEGCSCSQSTGKSYTTDTGKALQSCQAVPNYIFVSRKSACRFVNNLARKNTRHFNYQFFFFFFVGLVFFFLVPGRYFNADITRNKDIIWNSLMQQIPL